MNAKYFKALFVATTIFFAASASAQTTKTQPQTVAQTQKLQTIKLKVGGITCAGDCKDIQKEVSKMNGVTACKLVGKPTATSTFEVTFDPAVVSEKEIRSKVEDTPGCDDPKERPYKVKQG